MSAFHRMVTYLHLYDHNIKGRNIGFAKIEKQNSKCRIEIHMKNTGYSISSIPVYFYTQKQQNFHGILLGDMELTRGNGDFKAILTEKDWAENGYSLENIKGIFIPISEETMLVSQWDNDPFVRDKFIEPPTPNNTPSQAGTHPAPDDTAPINPQTMDNSQQNTHPRQINTKSIPFQKTENTQQLNSPKNSISAANTAMHTQRPQQHNAMQDSTPAANTALHTDNSQQHSAMQDSDSAANTARHTDNSQQHSAMQDSSSDANATQKIKSHKQHHGSQTSSSTTNTTQHMQNAQQQDTLQDSTNASNSAQNTQNPQQQDTLQDSTNASNTTQHTQNAQQQDTLQDSTNASNSTQNTQNPQQQNTLQNSTNTSNSTQNTQNPQQQKNFHQADTPQNSLKATEAAPRRRQAVYRNPFALPRFPLWQQDFKQRQRIQGKAPNTASQSSKTAKNTPEAANYNAKIPPNTANYNAKIPSNTANYIAKTPSNTANYIAKTPPNTADDKAQTSPDTSGQSMDTSSMKPSPPSDEDWSMKWQMLLENYPVMTPFAGDEKTLCIRLDLKDLRLLPQKYWYLGNNSFLLHGFFNYRYLILGITEKSGRKKWFLGIPGIFQNPERVMATLFGFPGFRNEKSASINTGEFGYWYRYLEE